MQHAQLNFVRYGTIAILLLAGSSAQAGSMFKPSKPDPLLDGGGTAPCAARTDYAAGRDVHGKPVIPADADTRLLPVPDAIAIPLASAGPNGRVRPAMGGSAYVSLDGNRVAPLVNPPPCR
jgi:hypothetical protein